jgi:hypothetical protein
MWAQARTSNLHEDLGQIDYIFSDKTGGRGGCGCSSRGQSAAVVQRAVHWGPCRAW